MLAAINLAGISALIIPMVTRVTNQRAEQVAIPALDPIKTLELLYYLVSGIGLILCVFWLRANQRTQKRIDYWQGCLQRMEPPDTYLSVFRVFSGSDWRKLSAPPLIRAINFLPWMFILAWLAMPGVTWYVFNLL